MWGNCAGTLVASTAISAMFFLYLDEVMVQLSRILALRRRVQAESSQRKEAAHQFQRKRCGTD
jgi:hypothetical protein